MNKIYCEECKKRRFDTSLSKICVNCKRVKGLIKPSKLKTWGEMGRESNEVKSLDDVNKLIGGEE